MLASVWKDVFDIDIPTPFPRILMVRRWKSMAQISQTALRSAFGYHHRGGCKVWIKVFSDVAEAGGVVTAI